MTSPDDAEGSRQTVRVESGFGYGVIGADLHVFKDRGPVYLLTEQRAHPEHDSDQLPSQPSRLLNARFQVVSFTGRARELDELTAWRDTTTSRVAARWLHAPGGQGKTRLAAEFAVRTAAAGWKVVSAIHGPGAIWPLQVSQDLRLHNALGLLLVVDYADRWPASHLNWLFSNALLHQHVPARVLLLARSLQPWPALRAALANLQAETGEQSLDPLPGGHDLNEREQMFTTARDAFAARYGLADARPIEPPGDLARPEFGLVLALHMAALVAVDAHVHNVRPPSDLAGLSSYLLDRERAHWDRLYANRDEGVDYSTPPSEMARTVFTAALAGPATYPQGTGILRGLGLQTGPSRLLADHATCYPPADPGAVLEPLYPDRLAEDFLALTLPGHTVTGHPAAPWAAATVETLSTHGDGLPPAHAARMVTFLASAAAPGRWPHVGQHLGPVLRADPALAIAAGSAALTALANADVSPATLQAVEARFPPGQHADLDPGIAALTARITGHRLATADDPSRRAALYTTLARRQRNAGLHAEALAANTEAVRLRRDLAEAYPNRYEPDLAGSLSDLGVDLAEFGRWEEAVNADQEAAEMFRRLAQTAPAANEPRLAIALSNLGAHLSRLGRTQEALAAEQEATAIFQLRAQTDPAHPDLATSLSNLGVHLSHQGQPEDGLAAEEQASEIRWRLATDNAARHQADLAASLSNLGNRLADTGRREEALAAAEQAVEIRRRLASANPAAHEAGLARSLSNLGNRLSDSGRPEEALAAEQEAVEIFRCLADANPAAYESALARSLTNLGARYSRLDRPAEALDATQQAVEIRRRLTAANPAAHESGLAESLSNLGVDLSQLGRRAEALTMIEQAVRILQRLAQTNRAHQPALARSLAALAQTRLDEGQDIDNALKEAAEATGILLLLARDQPAAYAPDLLAALPIHEEALRRLGRTREADALAAFGHGDPGEFFRMLGVPGSW